jgi:hypothetical protein
VAPQPPAPQPPATQPSATQFVYADPAPERPKRKKLRVAFGIVAWLAFLALAVLAGYLWFVNSQWVSQNEALRADAVQLGEQLATERALSQEQAESLDLVDSQLTNATSRISDLANEEANALDDRNVLENLLDAYQSCADERQSHIDVLTSNLVYVGKTSAQVERELIEFCDDVEDGYDEYKKTKAAR